MNIWLSFRAVYVGVAALLGKDFKNLKTLPRNNSDQGREIFTGIIMNMMMTIVATVMMIMIQGMMKMINLIIKVIEMMMIIEVMMTTIKMKMKMIKMMTKMPMSRRTTTMINL